MDFKDQIIIDGKKIIEIPVQNLFFEEKDMEIKTKFSDPPKKHKIKKNS